MNFYAMYLYLNKIAHYFTDNYVSKNLYLLKMTSVGNCCTTLITRGINMVSPNTTLVTYHNE